MNRNNEKLQIAVPAVSETLLQVLFFSVLLIYLRPQCRAAAGSRCNIYLLQLRCFWHRLCTSRLSHFCNIKLSDTNVNRIHEAYQSCISTASMLELPHLDSISFFCEVLQSNSFLHTGNSSRHVSSA